MRRMRGLGRTAGAAALTLAACGGGPAEGRWERVGQPSEWVELRDDGTFLARSFMGTDTIRGTFTVSGDTVRVHSTYGYSGTLVLRDSLLVMPDGTRFRRPRR